MSNRTPNSNYFVIIAQTVAWVLMFLTPALSSLSMAGDYASVTKAIQYAIRTAGPMCVLYFLNYFVLIPKLLFGQKPHRVWFFVINAVLILGWCAYMFAVRGPLGPTGRPRTPRPGTGNPNFNPQVFLRMRLIHTFTRCLTYCLVVTIAYGVRKIVASNDLLMAYEQERRNAAEAELSWLKNQLNPHFLFNTLNNISSLTQIDPDKAQDSIGQFSDLLRYALYDSDREAVPVEGEVEFMENYIDLMQLRCNELAKVTSSFNVKKGIQIAPLLFISLLENAFKHGVNARKQSFVTIDMHMDGPDLVFHSENSLFEKPESEEIGSGIGLENMKRRLDLTYPDAYSYNVEEGGGVYSATVRIKGIGA